MKKRFVLFFMVLFALTLSGCEYLTPYFNLNDTQFQSTLISSRDTVRQSNISVEMTVYHQGAFSSVDFESQGSGVVFDEDETYYYALTNYHVIDTRDGAHVEYKVFVFGNLKAYPATVIASDMAYDLAILRFEKAEQEIPLIDMQTRLDDTLKTGEMVLAVGSPSRVDSIVTFGEYGGMVDIDQVDFKVIYHTALIFKGNSGGALTDINGHLIGINTWGQSGSADGSLAVGLDEIHAFLASVEFEINT